MRLTIIEPGDSCREMRGSVEALLFAMQLEARTVDSPSDRQGLAQAIATALATADLVLVIGGMSHGGYAFEAASDALSRPLVRSNAAARYIEQRCREQDLIFSEFESCCYLPQGAKSFAGDGVFPACLCRQGDRALLLFDEYNDPAQLLRLKALLSALSAPHDAEPELSSEAQPPAQTAEPLTGYATPAQPSGKARSAKRRPPRTARHTGRGKQHRKAAIGCVAISCVMAVMALAGVIVALLGTADTDIPAQKTIVSNDSSEQQPVLGPVREVPSWRLKASSSSSSSEPEASPEPEAALSASQAPSSSVPTSSSQPEAPSSAPPVISSSEPAVSSSVPEVPSSSTPESSEDEAVYIYEGDEEEDEEDEPPRSSGRTPSAHEDVFDETLSYSSGGGVRRMNAYDLVCQVLQNETHGNLAPEALKAHVVATYTMIKYNNAAGIAPAVLLNTDVSSAVKNAVEAVLGVSVYYKGHYANTVYHSTSCGSTTSSQAVWGGALPYLVSVESEYDRKSPYYKSSYVVPEKDFATKVKKVYGIMLDGDPEDWIAVEHDAPGGYVGTVEIGGETRSQGGTYGTGLITGRSVREKLLAFALRSHCFDVSYNASKERFEFTVYGYGHGVGMSQYGAHYMALDGYDYVEILEHYYTGTEIY